MTVRQIFEATEIELNKNQAPGIQLQEFNYYLNKAINQYINKVYNTYDLNQQTTDDLRVLKSTAFLTPKKYNPTDYQGRTYLSSKYPQISSLYGATYEVNMPIDYLHLLNCVCIYYVAKTKDCWDAGSYIQIPATRLTADSWSQVITDIYNRPTPTRPYYYIHNQGASNSEILPTSPITEVSELGIPNGTDMTGTYQVVSNGVGEEVITVYKDASTTGLTTPVYYADIGPFKAGWKYKLEGVSINEKQKTISYAKATYTNLLPGLTELGKYIVDDGEVEMQYPNPEDTVGWSKDGKLQNQAPSTSGVGSSNFPRTLKLDLNADGVPDTNVSLVEKPTAIRASNPSNVRLEIRYGRDDSVFQLKEVVVDYVKSPQFIRLSQEQFDSTEDTSQIMEFPDYVNQEIINELVHLVMEHNNDPRLANNLQISQSIARPTGQQTQQARA